MPRHSYLLALALCFLASCPSALAADEKKDKKEEKKPEPPRVIVALPLAVTPGTTNLVRLRGNNLTDVSELRFTNAAVQAAVTVKSKTKVEVPKDADAKKVGDTQIELELSFPADTPPGTNWFTVASTNGVSAVHPIIVLPTGAVTEEKEPNGGFKQAQPIASGRTLLGSVKEAADVDVFRFEGKAGQQVRVEVAAARLGSALDSLVTLYDSSRHILASNDDVSGNADSVVVAKLPGDGTCYVSLIDAQDRGGPTFVYLLKVSVER